MLKSSLIAVTPPLKGDIFPSFACFPFLPLQHWSHSVYNIRMWQHLQEVSLCHLSVAYTDTFKVKGDEWLVE
jgi:hypothetical protein